jgi:serine-type D-Ala-D-Ala carboxypeptidase (penicillin-binding protein 5/6)
MFDSNEKKSFQNILRGIMRILIFLVVLFMSGEFVLNKAFSNHFSKVNSVTIESGLDASLASATNVFASIENSARFLAQVTTEAGSKFEASAPPSVNAGSYIVANLDSGKIYAEKNADDVKSIASISKLVTALTASGSLITNPIIEVTESSRNTRGTMANFTAGEKMTLRDLYYPLLLSSANDAALVISNYYGEDLFDILMNKQVRKIGMINSHFVEPSGLSGDNRSTARELYLLSRHIHENNRYIFDITEIEEKTIESILPTGATKSVRYKNIHQLRNMEGFAGGKNGFTNAAGKTLLSLFTVQNEKGDDETVVIIVLGSDDGTRDSLSLLSWLKSSL